MELIREYQNDDSPLVMYDPVSKKGASQQILVPYQIWYEGPGPPGPPPLCANVQPTSMCFNLQVNGYNATAMMESEASQKKRTALVKHLRLTTQPTQVQVQIANGKFASARAIAGPLAISLEGIITLCIGGANTRSYLF
eukprot:1057317-Pelagomonas_calceolata.AAC.1